jgi:hypothetical protein
VYQLFHLRYNDGGAIEISDGGVLSKLKSAPVNITKFPARSVAVILILPIVLSVLSNAYASNQLLLVHHVISMLLAKLVIEYSILILFGQKFISVHVFHVMLYKAGLPFT